MGNNNPFTGILALLGIGILLIFLFPPLFFILIAAGIYLWFKFRNVRKQMEQELENQQTSFYQETADREPTYQDDLFQEQVSRLRDENAEVIDVEFTRKDTNEGEKQSL